MRASLCGRVHAHSMSTTPASCSLQCVCSGARQPASRGAPCAQAVSRHALPIPVRDGQSRGAATVVNRFTKLAIKAKMRMGGVGAKHTTVCMMPASVVVWQIGHVHT